MKSLAVVSLSFDPVPNRIVISASKNNKCHVDRILNWKKLAEIKFVKV